jgi:hypothetical protein
MIENAGEDLNCVTLTVSETGSAAGIYKYRLPIQEKVIKVERRCSNSLYDLTLFLPQCW